MFGMFRNLRNRLQNNRMGKKIMGMGQDQSASAGGIQPPVDHNMNFAHKFNATDEDLAKTRDLNDSDLYSDGSSKYTRMDVRRHDGGDTESLNYPNTPNLKGKGSNAA